MGARYGRDGPARICRLAECAGCSGERASSSSSTKSSGSPASGALPIIEDARSSWLVLAPGDVDEKEPRR